MASYGIACLLLLSTVPLVNGDGCNATFTATNSSVTQSAKTGSGICTWTFETQEVNSLVSLNIINVSLSVGPPCSTNNSIVIYDGDLTGPVTGIVCEGYMDIASVNNTIVLQYSADLVKSETSFAVNYISVPESECSIYTPVDVTSYSPNEYSLFTPRYPEGITGSRYECQWSVRSYKSERTRAHVEVGANSTTTCQDAELSFETILDTLKDPVLENVTWCPGKPNIFQTWNGHELYQTVNVHSENSLMVKYRKLEASTCLGQYTPTVKRQTLTTTNFPKPYPSFEECRWHIKKNVMPQGHSIRIDVIESDMEPSEICYTDVFQVYGNDVPPSVLTAVLAGEMCDNVTRSFYLYIPSAFLIFRSWRENVNSKGIKVTYGFGEVEQCGGNYTAKSSPQQIKSLGYPVAFPILHSCQFSITVEDPLQYVQVTFLDTHLSEYRDKTFVNAIDGKSSLGYLLGTVNHESKPTFQAAQESMLLNFYTGFYQDAGFLLEYKQVKDPIPLRRHRTLQFKKGKLSSPRYPSGKIRDMDAVWTLTSTYDEVILLAFDNVDLGDEKHCSDNFVTVYNGNMSDSKARKTTLCGKERGAFLAQGELLTVVFKTDNTTSKKGFVANYTTDSFDGCTGTVNANTGIIDKVYIQTPNFPYMYPRNMNCEYRFSAFYDRDILSLKILQMGMKDTNCQQDYVEIFDGPRPSSNSLGRYCGDQTATVSSTGKQMFVRIVSGSKGGGIGCKISVDTVDNDKTPLIAGLSAGGVLLVLALILFIMYVIVRRRQRHYDNIIEPKNKKGNQF